MGWGQEVPEGFHMLQKLKSKVILKISICMKICSKKLVIILIYFFNEFILLFITKLDFLNISYSMVIISYQCKSSV
jgi:hypothetical protein